MTKSLHLVGALLLLLATATGQTVIDATGPVRQLRREPTSATVGAIGRKVPIRVSIALAGPLGDGMATAEFTLLNEGREEIMIPVWPHPRDIEPPEPAGSYSYTVPGLRLNATRGGRDTVLPGGTELFGSLDFGGTLIALHPGQSIRVLVRVALPQDKDGMTFTAYAGLDNTTVRTVRGQTSAQSQEIGYSMSRVYSAAELSGAVQAKPSATAWPK
jgi:hypothetical protein